MKQYEVFVEEKNPCGGEDNLRKTGYIETKAESPEAYVKLHGKFPILDVTQNAKGETVVHTGDGSGSFATYTFSEVE